MLLELWFWNQTRHNNQHKWGNTEGRPMMGHIIYCISFQYKIYSNCALTSHLVADSWSQFKLIVLKGGIALYQWSPNHCSMLISWNRLANGVQVTRTTYLWEGSKLSNVSPIKKLKSSLASMSNMKPNFKLDNKYTPNLHSQIAFTLSSVY